MKIGHEPDIELTITGQVIRADGTREAPFPCAVVLDTDKVPLLRRVLRALKKKE
jgi:hypothetical protein